MGVNRHLHSSSHMSLTAHGLLIECSLNFSEYIWCRGVTVKPLMLVCPLFHEFRKGYEYQLQAKIRRNYYSILN